MRNSKSGNNNSSSHDRCKNGALRELAKDSAISSVVCASRAMSERRGNNHCYKRAMKADQERYSSNLNQCKINEINRQISAKGGISAGDDYTSSSFPGTSTSDHHKTTNNSIIKNGTNGTSPGNPPAGYLSMFNIVNRHSDPIPGGEHFTFAYISNASPFYYDGQHNSLPTYIGRNNVRFWAKPDGVYQIGTGFTEGVVEKHYGMTQEHMYNAYKCKQCGGFSNCTAH